MEGWAAQELQYAQLGDARRNKRLVQVVEALAGRRFIVPFTLKRFPQPRHRRFGRQCVGLLSLAVS
jgi:hypothetical protein